MTDHRLSRLKKLLGIELLEGRVRAKLRPVGVLAVSFLVTGVVSVGVGALASAIYGEQAFHPAQMFSSGAGKAISVVTILMLARDDFGLNRLVPGNARWWSVPVGILVAGGLFVLEWLYDPTSVTLADLTGYLAIISPSTAALATLSAVTFAIGGGVEELLFRGMIQTSAEKYYRPTAAVVLTAVLFSAPHLNFGWLPFVELFVVSLAFSWYRRVAGSLVLPITVHACHNLLYGITLAVTN